MALDVRPGPMLSERTTLRLGGQAQAEVVLRRDEDLDALAEYLLGQQLRPFVLGAGSNLLAADGQLDVALVRAANVSGPNRVEEADGDLVFRAGAGLRLPGLLGWAQKAGLKGLEPLAGIPGTIGGAVAMNAGSYGASFGQFVRRVRLWTPGAGLIWREARACTFGYRHFDPNLPLAGHVIWEVEMALPQSKTGRVRKRMLDHYKKKKASQPVTAHTAGCVFKNPDGESAGRLLDKAGFRGKTLGNMAFSEMHANFLVNLGNGTSAQALELMEQGRQAVAERFGVQLEPEVVILT